MASGGSGISPATGRPAIITPEERVQLMVHACTKPDDASNQWTMTKFADAQDKLVQCGRGFKAERQGQKVLLLEHVGSTSELKARFLLEFL